MISLIIFLSSVLSVLAVGVLAGVSDWNGLKIPNIYSILVAAGFFICYALLWILGDAGVFNNFLNHIAAGVLVFIISALLFTFKMLGAADSKLATAYAFWAGLQGAMAFLFMMTIFGALIAIMALIIRKHKPFKTPKKDSWIDQVQAGASKVPYGIAIVAGAAYAFIIIGYFDFVALAETFDL